MLAVAFHHTTRKKMAAGSLNQTTHKKNGRRLIKLNHAQKKMAAGSFFFTTHSKKWLKAHFFRVTPTGVLRGKLPLSSAGEREGAWGRENPRF
ncbi:MAG: hypothetical protein U0K92_07545 [Treponema sp.]|nr:hypothetical protein [Treponema sp.]